MTRTELEVATPAARESAATHQAGSSALRRSALIRIVLAVSLAGGLTAATIAAVWAPHPSTSDVIGYPIVADYNPNNYVHAYYLLVGLFPIAALLIFLGLTRFGPRIRLAVPPPRGRLWPLDSRAEAEGSVGSEPSTRTYGRVAAIARVAFVGAVLGLEVGVATNHPSRSILLVGVGYSLVLGLGAVALRGGMLAGPTWETPLATLNSLATPLTVAGLSLVSAHTGVRVAAGNTVHHYPWFPAWLGVPLAAAIFAWLVVRLRHASATRARTIEWRAVVFIAAPVALFVLVAALPGDLGKIDLYEEGQFLTEARLVLHGWLPWRDVVVVHGVLRDVIPTAVGWRVFGNSYWGSVAGSSLIFLPLSIVATYWLLAYLVGRSWPLLLVGAAIYLGTWFGTADVRYLLWPLSLLVLAASIKRPTRSRAAALGVGTVVQAIVTPEMLGAVPIVAIVVAAYELYSRLPGVPLARSFHRTIWVAIGVVVSAGAFAIYMASRGALGDVILVTRDSLAAKFNQGIAPSPGFSQPEYDVIALAPLVAVLVSFAYAVGRLRLRRPFLLADWPMAAAALFVAFYYTIFLTFMDLPHAYEPFMVATPLMLYIIYRAATAVEQWIRARVPEGPARWLPAHPVGLALLIVFLVAFWGSLRTTVENVPTAYQPTALGQPIAHVGYAAQYDAVAVDDLRHIVKAYLGPHDRLLDMTNEAALFFYFLGRDPSSRWFAPVSVLSTPQLQGNLLADLRQAPPKLIIFDDTDTNMVGLPNLNGVPAPAYLYLVSRWILSHYRPLVESHGRMIYALSGLPPLSSRHLRLRQEPASVGVPFRGQECSWGYAPTFLEGPVQPAAGARAVPVRTAGGPGPQVTFTGWAGDVRTREPAREVIATFNGKIIARATPNIERPDVPAAGYPAGFLHSGFSFSIPIWANASAELKVFAVGRDGSVAQLAVLNRPAVGGVAKIGSRMVNLQPTADTGHVDAETPSGAVLQLEAPAGSSWADYRWLELDAPTFTGFRQGTFDLSDRPGATDPGRVISFGTLARSPRHYVIPVSSCAQWHGYGSSRLFLMSSPAQQIGGVRLIR